MKEELKKRLIDLGYKEWNSHSDYSNFFQKTIKHNNVCDLNDKLFFNIHYRNIKNEFEARYMTNTFTLELVAKKHEEWFKLQCFEVEESHFLDKLDSLQDKLLKSFDALCI